MGVRRDAPVRPLRPGGEFWFAGERIPLAIGQFIESEEEIARPRASRGKSSARSTERRRPRSFSREEAHARRASVRTSQRCSVTPEFSQAAAKRARDEPPRATQGPRTGPPTAAPTGREGAHQNKGTKETREPEDTNPPPSPAAPAPPSRRRSKAGTNPDPRHAPFVAAASEVFKAKHPGARFDFDAHDGKRLQAFLARHAEATADEWRSVYGRALDLGAKWPGTAKVAQALDRWNDLAGAAVMPITGRVTAPAAPASAFVGGDRELS